MPLIFRYGGIKKKIEVSIFEWVYWSVVRQKNITMHQYTDVSSQPYQIQGSYSIWSIKFKTFLRLNTTQI
jgi:hypothetical protein